MSKMYYPLYGMIEQKGVILPLIINLASDASVDSFQGKGVESVTKSGTGEYTIVLKDKYNKLLSAALGKAGAIADVDHRVKSVDLANKTIVVATDDGSVDADTAVAHAVHLTVVTTKSSVA